MEGLQTNGRVFFGMKRHGLDRLSSSVAVEELHDFFSLSAAVKELPVRHIWVVCLQSTGNRGLGRR